MNAVSHWPVQDAAFELVEGPPPQEGDVDWEEAAVADKADDGDAGAGSDGDEEGGLTAYAAGAAQAEQVHLDASTCCCRRPHDSPCMHGSIATLEFFGTGGLSSGRT